VPANQAETLAAPVRIICREVQVNLAYRWFCKLGIEDAIPDHSAFSRARNERFREGDVFRRVFERVVEACIAAGLLAVTLLNRGHPIQQHARCFCLRVTRGVLSLRSRC
jgi:Transposase domain (DUF772)